MEIHYYKQGSIDVLAVLDLKTRSLRTETGNFEIQGGDALPRPDQNLKRYLPVALAAEANKSENFIFRKSLSNLSN